MAAISQRFLSSTLGTATGTPRTDTFTRANSTTTMGSTETGQAWSAATGTWGIDNNQAYLVNNVDGQVMMEVGAGDMDVSCTITAIGSTPGGSSDLLFRGTDANNFWILDHNGSAWQLYKRVGGSFTASTTTSVTPTVGDVLRVVAVGSTIDVYINNVLQITVTDSFNSTATKAGFRSSNNTGGRFDNFSAAGVTGGASLMAAHDTTAGATNATTTMNYGTGTGSRRVTPKVAVSTAASPPTVGAAASGIGFVENSINHPNQDSPAANHPSTYRISGTWTFNYAMTLTGGTLAPTAQMTVICYAVGGGASRELWRHTSSNLSIGLTETAFTHTTSAVASTQVNIGERLQYEFYLNVSANSNLVATIVQFRIGAGSGAVGAPAGPNVTGGSIIGLSTRSPQDSAPASDGGPNRTLFFPRNLTETRPTTETLARTQTLLRVGSESAFAVDTLSRSYLAARTLIETTSIADLLGRGFIGTRGLTETRPTTETLGVSFTGTRALTETRPTTDLVARQFVGTRTATETIPTTETLGRTALFSRVRVESIPIGTDTAVRSLTLTRNLTETVPTTDSISRVLTYVRKVKEYPPGAAPDYEMEFPTRVVTGVVRDVNDAPVSGATVKLFRQSDDKMIESTTSAANGTYAFIRDTFDPNLYYVISYLAGSPQTQGITERGLEPE